jgi:hypothetical protein
MFEQPLNIKINFKKLDSDNFEINLIPQKWKIEQYKFDFSDVKPIKQE